MHLVFIGTPDFAVPTLIELIKTHDVAAVVTQPDRPKGRHLHPAPSAVKEIASANSLPILQPETLKENIELENNLRRIDPQAIVVAAYGKIIPKWLLELPESGCLNLHGSLLPEYRGAAPIQRAILDGRKITGVTSMLMDEGLDTGDILLQEEVAIEPDDDSGSLTAKMAVTGAHLIIKTLRELSENILKPISQNEEKATYAEKIAKEERLIEWCCEAAAVNNKIRALSPRPGAYTLFNGMRVKIFKAHTAGISGYHGDVLESGDRLTVAAGKSGLVIEEIQPEGKRIMSGEEFARGYRVAVGDRFGV